MKTRPLLIAALAGLAWAAAAQAHERHGAPAAPSAAPASTAATTGTRDAAAYFTDTVLTDQDGRRLRFYSDVLKDKVVLINVMFASCKDACPLITGKLVEARSQLAEETGRQVVFVSLTTDPERDTPPALKAFARKNKAEGENWIFLTGGKADVDRVLKRLGQFAESAEEHSTLLIAGNVAQKRWRKIRPDAPPVAIAEVLRQLSGTGTLLGSPLQAR